MRDGGGGADRRRTGRLTREADVDDEDATLVPAVGGADDGADEVGDVGAAVQTDGDDRDLPAAATGEGLVHGLDLAAPFWNILD